MCMWAPPSSWCRKPASMLLSRSRCAWATRGPVLRPPQRGRARVGAALPSTSGSTVTHAAPCPRGCARGAGQPRGRRRTAPSHPALPAAPPPGGRPCCSTPPPSCSTAPGCRGRRRRSRCATRAPTSWSDGCRCAGRPRSTRPSRARPRRRRRGRARARASAPACSRRPPATCARAPRRSPCCRRARAASRSATPAAASRPASAASSSTPSSARCTAAARCRAAGTPPT